MRKWFTADLHLDHTNIIKYCNRPFSDVHHMNQEIIRRFCEVVSPRDIIYLLGDVSFNKGVGTHLDQIPGTKVLIRGNHDHSSYRSGYTNDTYEQVCDIKMVKVSGCKVFLSHYAHRVWPESHRGVIHLYGHSHGTLPGFGRSMDVGVDTNDFYPYSEADILKRMKKIDHIAVDHHVSAFSHCVEG